jgi:FkbM family methyltransferase
MKKIIQKMLGLAGLRLVKVPRQSLKSLIRNNTETGGNEVEFPKYNDVETIIDVGVSGGTPWLYKRFPTQGLILVEPLNVVSELGDMLKGRNYEMYECAVGASEGEIVINFDVARPSLSSVLDRTELTSRDGHRLEKRTVQMRTLDSLISETSFPTEKIGLKIDTEGFELDVLKGSVKTLPKCEFVVCEASIEKRFEESYEFSDLILFMADNGFKLKKILRFAVDINNVVRMADVLFEPV